MKLLLYPHGLRLSWTLRRACGPFRGHGHGHALQEFRILDKAIQSNGISQPCKNVALMMLSARPTHPMMRMSFGFSTPKTNVSKGFGRRKGPIPIRWRDTNLSMDCKKMLTPNARRKTPLKNAPSSCARCQPKDSCLGDSSRADIYLS